MYLNKLKKPNGDIYLSIREKYHVPKVGSRERTIKSIGYVSELRKKYDDPIAHFTRYAKAKAAKRCPVGSLDKPIDMLEKVTKPELRIRALRALYSMATALAVGFLSCFLHGLQNTVKFFMIAMK